MTTEQTTPAQTFAEAVHAAMEFLGTVREACVGYRAQCLADGFSETAAEEMAIQVHSMFITRLATVVAAQ